jgi:CRISPR-associated endonuclease/helicase Cas3
MAELTANDFSAFFEAVHNKPDVPEDKRKRPFDWQMRLAKQVLEDGQWPGVIRVPTACGKTSVLDIALFELALQVGRQAQELTAARRICFVIDRRLVVDEVTEHAKEIRQAVCAAARAGSDEPIVEAVVDRLKALATDAAEPLRVVRLRGSVYRDDSWAADPLTPTILVSTVDQIGSRLLFRGYGLGRRNRAVHAGLLAFDTRIILDEAHLSSVFATTLGGHRVQEEDGPLQKVGGIRQYQQWAERPPVLPNRRVSIVCMSATAGEGERPFPKSQVEWQEMQDDRVKVRLNASKPADLIPVEVTSITEKMRQEQPRRARELEQENREKLVKKLVEQAKQRAGLDGDGTTDQEKLPRVLGVVVNRVATARQVFERLEKKGKNDPERGAILLTGRIRPYDRDRLLQKWLPKIKAARENEPEDPLFVVATQTVEVGANLDFDSLITEAAPLDALRQRFGRLDRLGKRHLRSLPSPGVILIRSDQKSKSDDPIYRQSIAETWKWLDRNASKKKGQPKQIEFGINHLDPKLPEALDQLRPMLAPQPCAPLLFPAHLDAWVQTNPSPDPDPDVAPFLHGQGDAAADVLVVWRADLDRNDKESWAKIVSLMPPRTREALPVPVYEVQAWLEGQATADVADVEGIQAEQPHDGQGLRVLRWRGPNNKTTRPIRPDELRPGDTIVVPASYGGADSYGWKPESDNSVAAVTDVAEACLAQLIASYPTNPYRRPKLRLRLHPSLFDALGVDLPVREMLKGLLRTALAAAPTDEAVPWPAIQPLLLALKEHLADPANRALLEERPVEDRGNLKECQTDLAHRAAIEALLEANHNPVVKRYAHDNGLVVTEEGIRDEIVTMLKAKLAQGARVGLEELEYEEPEEDERSRGQRPVSLVEHTQGVERLAIAFASRCGLERQFIEAVGLAARWHDEGKRDRRFQAWLHGSELAALATDQPLAKSGWDPKKKKNRFGYPRGARHEFVSVRLFERAYRVNGAETDDEIVKLLIGTHHGHGRPFPPVVRDRKPVEIALNHDGHQVAVSSDHLLYRLDSGWMDRFWRMVRRYGWWGLAYLEAMLVTADHLVSGQEQRQTASQTEETAP